MLCRLMTALSLMRAATLLSIGRPATRPALRQLPRSLAGAIASKAHHDEVRGQYPNTASKYVKAAVPPLASHHDSLQLVEVPLCRLGQPDHA